MSCRVAGQILAIDKTESGTEIVAVQHISLQKLTVLVHSNSSVHIKQEAMREIGNI